MLRCGYAPTRFALSMCWTVWVSACLVLLACPTAYAQFSSDFETLNADADGEDLNGQLGFYNPNPAASVTCLAYTYAGNTLGLPANPSGGDKFVAGTGPAGATFARSQRDMVYGDGTGIWTISFDVAVTFTGTLPTTQNVGSLSSQLFPGEATFIALARWVDPVTAVEWNADYVWFDAAGTQILESVADPAFQNLAINAWYHWTTTFSLDNYQILEVSITDPAGVLTTNNPVDRYLSGAGGAPPPSGFRFFAGSSSVAGNTMAFDNYACQQPGGMPTEFIRGDFNNDGGVNFLVDALFGLNAGFVPGSPQPPCLAAADANGDRNVNFLVDSLFMLNAGFVPGSPLPPAPHPNCGPDQNGIDTLGCDTPSCP